MRSPEGETLFDTQWELDDQLWFLPLKSSRMFDHLLGMFYCLSLPALQCRPLLAQCEQSHTNSTSGRDRPSGVCCPEDTNAVCAHPTFVPAPLGHRADPHVQTVPLAAVVSHLSMLMAQRFRMLAVHIMTSMVTKMSQQMRLNVQTPPVTCTSDTELSALPCTRA